MSSSSTSRASCSTCSGGVELRLVADEVVDPAPVGEALDDARPRSRGRRSTSSGRASAARGARTAPTPRPGRCLVKIRPTPAPGAVVVVHLEREGGLAAVHRPGEEDQFRHEAPSLAATAVRRRPGTWMTGTATSSRGHRAVQARQREQLGSLARRESTTAILVGASRRRRRRSGRGCAAATGPNQPAATTSSRVRTQARVPEPRPATGPGRPGAARRRCRGASARGSPPDVPHPRRAGPARRRRRAGRSGRRRPCRGRRSRSEASRLRADGAASAGQLAVDRLELVAPLPRVAAVDVADLVEVAPVEVDERPRGGAHGGSGGVDPVGEARTRRRTARRAGAARVRPDPSKKPGPTRVTATPSATARSKTVASGCHALGVRAVLPRQLVEQPVLARHEHLVAEQPVRARPAARCRSCPSTSPSSTGTRSRPGMPSARSERSHGAWPPRRRSSSWPRPSRRTTTARGAASAKANGRRPTPRPGHARGCVATDGRTSASPAPVGSRPVGRPASGPAPSAPGEAADRSRAKSSASARACSPSAAAEIRSAMSSAATVPS